MIRLDLRRAVIDCIYLFHFRACGTGILMANDAVAGRDANFTASGSRRKGQRRGAVLGRGVHGQVLGIYVLLRGRGRRGNLRNRLSVQGLPVSGHADRNTRCRRRTDGRRAGEGAQI